jgi:pre-mRNA-splicing factor SYF1
VIVVCDCCLFAHDQVVYILYERALKLLPRSYKLWFAYLNLRKSKLRGRRIDHPSYQILANTYERALVHLNKMPRIW